MWLKSCAAVRLNLQFGVSDIPARTQHHKKAEGISTRFPTSSQLISIDNNCCKKIIHVRKQLCVLQAAM